MLSVRVRANIGDLCGLIAVGVIGRGEGEDVEEGAGGVASEFLDLAFPLLYIP